MESTQPQKTQSESNPLDSTGNADKLAEVSELLGVVPEVTAERPEPEAESVSEAIVELATDESPTDSGESQEPINPPKNLDELAERLNIGVAELYKLELPDPTSGESHTLGELKDMLANTADLTGRELELNERRVKQENEQVKSRQDLEEILKSLPPEAIMPEVLAKARLEREVYLERELVRVLDVIPEWDNAERKRTDWKGIQDHMAEYGYSPTQVDNIAEHQMIRFMRDAMINKTLIEKALARSKPVTRIAKSRAAKPAPKKTAPTATPQSHINDQLAAIDALIK